MGGNPRASQHYVVTMYLNAGLEVPSESISEEQARRALEVAKEVIRVVREVIEGAP